MQTVDVAETYPISSSWWDADQQAAEPSSIDLVVTAPDGTETAYTKADMTSPVVSGTLDTWVYMLLFTAEGLWRWTFTAVIGGTEVTQGGMAVAGEPVDPPGPCEPWCSWDDVGRLCPGIEGLDTVSTGLREHLIDVASWLLWALDGGHYPGLCERRRRLCRECNNCHRDPCRCSVRGGIDLEDGRWPVLAAWDVVVDGVTLPQSSYTVLDRRWLVRADDEPWPRGDPKDPDAFTASWAWGRRPPVGLRDACAQLVAQMAKRCLGRTCELPQYVTSVNREGTSYLVLDYQKFLNEGRTGVGTVDLALTAARLARRPAPGGAAPIQRRAWSRA